MTRFTKQCGFAAALSLLLALPACALGEKEVPASTPRSLWVWKTDSIRASPPAQTTFFQFLAAPHGAKTNAIQTIYFDGLDYRQLADPAIAKGVRGFLRAAHARHLRVDFLTGDPGWVTATGQKDGLRLLNAVLTFNRGGAATERYDGFQYDVEPYSLPDWPAPALRQGMLDLLDKSNVAIKASRTRLLLSVAIPRWYDQPQFGFLDRAIIDRTDEVVIMDYVTNPTALVADATGELEYAAKVGKKVWVGVETGALPETPNSTFFGRGNTAMESVLSAAVPTLHRYRSFAGYAIHHWESYKTQKR